MAYRFGGDAAIELRGAKRGILLKVWLDDGFNVRVQCRQMVRNGFASPLVEVVEGWLLPCPFVLPSTEGDSVPSQCALGPTLAASAKGVEDRRHELPTRRT